MDEEAPWHCAGMVEAENLPKTLQWTQTALVCLFRVHRQVHDPSNGSSACKCGSWTGPMTTLVRGDERAFELHLARLVLDGPDLCPVCGTAMVQLGLNDFLCETCGMTAAG